MRICLKLPSRTRPQKCVQTINAFKASAQDQANFYFLITLDQDDPQLATYQGLLQGLPNVTIDLGASRSKVEAYNASLADHPWDILVLISDDMVPKPSKTGWDIRIIRDMERHHPDLDGSLFYPDGHRDDDLAVMPVMGRKYYERFGYAYNPSYKSLWCDWEFTKVAQALKKFTKCKQCIIEHQHPVWTKEKPDALLNHNDTFYKSDEAIYRARKAINFDLPPPPPKFLLTIGILTIPERAELLKRQLDALNAQITPDVEIIIKLDDKKLTRADKRNQVLEEAQGKYIAFVDDDDLVTPIYVSEILRALKETPDATHASFEGLTYLVKSGKQKPFYHSLDHKSYYENAEGYYRYPNHLNAIRADIARKIGFNPKRSDEDTDFATRLHVAKLLTKEAKTSGNLYDYFYDPRISTYRAAPNNQSQSDPNKPIRTVILNVAYGQWFPKGQARLIKTFRETGYQGDFLPWLNQYPPGSPNHQDSPYAFKVAAFYHAINEGYDIALWVDSSIFAIRNIQPILDEIKEKGHVFFYSGGIVGEWCSDAALKQYPFTRDEAMSIPEVCGGLWGVDLRREENRAFLKDLHKHAHDGISFLGPWTNKNNEASTDPRVRGHRHDQPCMSHLVRKYDFQPTHCPRFFAYQFNKPFDTFAQETILLCEGIG